MDGSHKVWGQEEKKTNLKHPGWLHKEFEEKHTGNEEPSTSLKLELGDSVCTLGKMHLASKLIIECKRVKWKPGHQAA